MTTIITLDGGLGRIITAIPALLKYSQNHPNEEWYIMIPGWDFITWGIPELQERTFNPDARGSFDLFWKADQVLSPEPYRVPAYYRNEISLGEAFDVEINDSTDHSDLPPMQLNISFQEKRRAYEIIEEARNKHKKSKTIVLQPYGSTATPHASGIFDDSLRSIPEPMLNYFVKELSKDYNLIFMGAKEFYNLKTYKPDPDPNLREWAAIIGAADYFVGCDSCGQHICKALNKKASVVIAGTHSVNVTYDGFHIIERDVEFYPDSMRISGFQAHMSSRLNEPRIDFTQKEIETAYQDIIRNIEGDKKPEAIEKPKEIKGVLYQ
jgi:curved DNA-binding protein CbpA